MFWILFACTVGSNTPADPQSVSGDEAQQMAELSAEAGRLANRSRDLERAAKEALDRVNAGGDPQAEFDKLEHTMKEIEALNAQLQHEHSAFNKRIRKAAQSTAATRE